MYRANPSPVTHSSTASVFRKLSHLKLSKHWPSRTLSYPVYGLSRQELSNKRTSSLSTPSPPIALRRTSHQSKRQKSSLVPQISLNIPSSQEERGSRNHPRSRARNSHMAHLARYQPGPWNLSECGMNSQSLSFISHASSEISKSAIGAGTLPLKSAILCTTEPQTSPSSSHACNGLSSNTTTPLPQRSENSSSP